MSYPKRARMSLSLSAANPNPPAPAPQQPPASAPGSTTTTAASAAATAAGGSTSSGPAHPTWIVTEGGIDEMQRHLLNYLNGIVQQKLRFNGYIFIALSGGSMPRQLAPVIEQLAVRLGETATRRLRFVMVDERHATVDHPESTTGAYLRLLPEHLQKLFVKYEVRDSLQASLAAYEQEVRVLGPEQIGKIPRFDVILLGIGPDGHTASLFPGRDLHGSYNNLPESSAANGSLCWYVPVEQSPKPPPQRITLSLYAINQGHNVAFIVTGAEKADVLSRIHAGPTSALPASHVLPRYGQLTYFVDAAAASQLPKDKL